MDKIKQGIDIIKSISYLCVVESKNANMNDQQNSLPTVPDNESSQAGSLALPVNKPTGKVFVFMNGWIKLHRSFLDWGWFSEDKMVRFFVYLLLKANYEDCEWMGIKVKRGELVTGRRSRN